MAAEPRHRWRCAVCLIVTLFLVPACSQFLGEGPKIRQKRRFTIVSEPIRYDLPVSLRPYPVTVQLKTLDIANHYNHIEIISRGSPYELRRDWLSVWALRPREMITQVVAEYLRSSQLFSRLATQSELLEDRPDYVISGSIRAIERFDSGDRWFARMMLTLHLVRQEDGQVIWRGEITENDEIEVFRADMEYTVQALSEILRRNMESFIRELDVLFMRMEEEPAPAVELATPTDTTTSPPAAALAAPDTAATVSTPDYYEVIPGKLAP